MWKRVNVWLGITAAITTIVQAVIGATALFGKNFAALSSLVLNAVLLCVAWIIIIKISLVYGRDLRTREDEHQRAIGDEINHFLQNNNRLAREINQESQSRLQSAQDRFRQELAERDAEITRLKTSLRRAERYRDSMVDFHEACRDLRNAYRAVTIDKDLGGVEHHLANTCANLANAFSRATGHPCWIQLISAYYDDPHIEGKSEYLKWRPVCSSKPLAWALKRDGVAMVEGNTDFLEVIHKPNPSWFFCNNLAAEPGYWNKEFRNGNGSQGAPNYLATIVWPVRWISPAFKEDRNEHKYQLALKGYLVLRSSKEMVFDEEMDTWLGAYFATAIYGLMEAMGKMKTPTQ